MAEVIYTLGPNNRIRLDTNTNKYSLEFYNSAAAAWEVVEQFDTANKLFEVISKLTANVEIEKSEPRLILDDKATGGVERRFASSGGAAKIKDSGGADVMNLESHQARHVAGGADELSGLTKTQVAADTVRFSVQIPVIFETAKTGLAADATGVKFESQDLVLTAEELGCLKGAYVEATWTASATDSATAIELYDVTGAAVVASVSGNTGTNVRSTAGSLTAGNVNRVRANVTTASATAGATTGCSKAVVILLFGVS